jgi:hypothetical protein
LTLAQLRRFALALPETGEAPHFDYTSFRVRGRIFATAPPSARYAHIFVGEVEREAALALYPEFVDTLYWGKKVAGIRVSLAKAKPAAVATLLRQAWQRKAPKKLAASLGGGAMLEGAP